MRAACIKLSDSLDLISIPAKSGKRITCTAGYSAAFSFSKRPVYNKMIMTDKQKSYDNFIKEQIALKASKMPNEVISLSGIGTYPYSPKLFNEIKSAVQQHQPIPEYTEQFAGNMRQYLDIFNFEDIHGKKYFAFVYDSDALEQDPTVIEILEQYPPFG